MDLFESYKKNTPINISL